MPDNHPLEVLAAGELLIDLISENYATSLDDVSVFQRVVGGSPANMAGNLKRLGHRVGLAASVGNDDMGRYMYEFVEKLGLDTRALRRTTVPSTLILVTRSREVSNFEAYRLADCEILPEQFPADLLSGLKIFHTTCFGLSREPARTSILGGAKRVVAAGGQLSIDANYAQKIWPNQTEAQEVVADYCATGALVKFSEVDWQRLYNNPLDNPAKAAEYLHDLGAQIVCLTLGGEGCFVSNGQEQHFLEARPINVKDTTGAGDAFWSGFLSAYLNEKDLLSCAKAGRKMAELKLQHFGPLPGKVDRAMIYE